MEQKKNNCKNCCINCWHCKPKNRRESYYTRYYCAIDSHPILATDACGNGYFAKRE